ncbi:hypothetical protein AVEN_130200-1 [Araneus ventricosus]|uniref:Uncharacterized protein n=1 Tax=Araneus ventricosus TaxID=182803 RepID=A0A4Y2L3Q5_ARAVE|nr:hypothetical protein AVEN_130200-1 [Araneus ventricosus]
MARRGQKKRAEETDEQRNRGLSDMAQRGQERRADGNRRTKESRLVDADLSKNVDVTAGSLVCSLIQRDKVR